ncbi:hypothetical protein IAU59_005820 [Kwoniella sp. CBS 9459]
MQPHQSFPPFPIPFPFPMIPPYGFFTHQITYIDPTGYAHPVASDVFDPARFCQPQPTPTQRRTQTQAQTESTSDSLPFVLAHSAVKVCMIREFSSTEYEYDHAQDHRPPHALHDPLNVSGGQGPRTDTGNGQSTEFGSQATIARLLTPVLPGYQRPIPTGLRGNWATRGPSIHPQSQPGVGSELESSTSIPGTEPGKGAAEDQNEGKKKAINHALSARIKAKLQARQQGSPSAPPRKTVTGSNTTPIGTHPAQHHKSKASPSKVHKAGESDRYLPHHLDFHWRQPRKRRLSDTSEPRLGSRLRAWSPSSEPEDLLPPLTPIDYETEVFKEEAIVPGIEREDGTRESDEEGEARQLRKAVWRSITGGAQNEQRIATSPLPDCIPFSSSPTPSPPEICIDLSTRLSSQPSKTHDSFEADSEPGQEEPVGDRLSPCVQLKKRSTKVKSTISKKKAQPAISRSEKEKRQLKAARLERNAQEAAAKRRGLTLEAYLEFKKKGKVVGKKGKVLGKKIDSRCEGGENSTKGDKVSVAQVERAINLLVDQKAAAVAAAAGALAALSKRSEDEI